MQLQILHPDQGKPPPHRTPLSPWIRNHPHPTHGRSALAQSAGEQREVIGVVKDRKDMYILTGGEI